MSEETEIKLAIPAEGLAAAETLFACDEPIEVCSTYFDTPDFLLRKHRIQVRVRQDGDVLLQTVKLPDDASGPLTRAEHEIPIRTAKLKRDHLMAVLPEPIRSEIENRELDAVFTTRFMRRRHLGGQGDVAEFAFDQGEIACNGRSVPIREVEIELKGDDLGAFIEASLAFLDTVPAGLIASGKAARGYRLAAETEPVGVPSKKIALTPDVLLPDAIRMLLRHHLTHFLNNIPAARAGLAEGIHQVRVGVRRLRSTISAFRPVMQTDDAAPVLIDLKAFFNRLGAVREADVFLAETLPQLEASGMAPKLAKTIAEETARYREEKQAQVALMLDSPETARLVVALYGWIEGQGWMRTSSALDSLLAKRPVSAFAGPRLRKLHKRLVKKGRAARESVSLDEWHEARIGAKKLRYAADPLLPTLGIDNEKADRYRKSVETIQEHLGHLNDLNVAEAFVKDVIQRARPNRRKTLTGALQAVHDWRASAQDRFILQAGQAFRAFEKEGFPSGKETPRK